MAVFLASDEGAFVNGQPHVVDGGGCTHRHGRIPVRARVVTKEAADKRAADKSA